MTTHAATCIAAMTGADLNLADLSLDPALLANHSGGLLVACSGGLDSTVLLHALAGRDGLRERGLRALHVHHGLHADADAWAAQCARLCSQLDVPLQLVHVQVARATGTGLEAAARQARHAAFEHELGNGEVLALAHHRDDQSETFLLRALRASGPDGLGAMRAWRSFGRGWLWRPLLSTPRAELLAYAQFHGLHWIDDPSNSDIAHDRNFLRQRVLPLLRERWTHADAAFARSAQLCADAAGLLDEEDTHALATVRTSAHRTLDCIALAQLPAVRRARVLRRWIAGLGLPPLPAAGVAAIESDLLGPAPGGDARFDWSGATIRRWRLLLHADHVRTPLPEQWQEAWDGQTPLSLPGGGALDLQVGSQGGEPVGFGQSLTVHARRGGERIILPGRTHSHALKHVLQDLGVPPWLRERLPLLSDADGKVLAAGDLACSAGFDAWLRENGARLAWSCP